MGCWSGHQPWHDYGRFEPPRRRRGEDRDVPEDVRADLSDMAAELRQLREEVRELRSQSERS